MKLEEIFKKIFIFLLDNFLFYKKLLLQKIKLFPLMGEIKRMGGEIKFERNQYVGGMTTIVKIPKENFSLKENNQKAIRFLIRKRKLILHLLEREKVIKDEIKKMKKNYDLKKIDSICKEMRKLTKQWKILTEQLKKI
jgi:hypothetical protein